MAYQDVSNTEKNKVIKNHPIWGIPQGLAYHNQPGGLFDPPCRIGLRISGKIPG